MATKIGKKQQEDKGLFAAQHSGKVTLQMVADACGVSASTVSRILNGTAQVSQQKRDAVDRAIAELGFTPNPVARGLAGGRTLSVGVISQAIDSPFYGVALRGIEEELSQVGYSALFVSGHWNIAEEKRCIDMLLSRRVDGLIILSGRLSDTDLRNLSKVVPVVVTGRDASGPNLYSLNFDNFEGARLATEHLLTIGHRNIAFIQGDPEHPDALERLDGYRAALKAAGIPLNPSLELPGNYREESGQLAVASLLGTRDPFSAIFAANDQMAMGSALALYLNGLHVPDDVSIVGFDDQAAAALAIPPLTTVAQGTHELGRRSALCLLQLLAGETPTLSAPKPRLVIRNSTRAIRAASVEQRISDIAFEAHCGIVVTNPRGLIERVNSAFTRLTGYTSEEAAGHSPGTLLKSGRQSKSFYQKMWTSLKKDGHWQGKLWNRHKNGQVFLEKLTIEAITAPDHSVLHYVGSFTDITSKEY
jgi:LacI family transcriptional regulator